MISFRFSKKVEFLILFLFICVYLILSIKDIILPGINFDEAFNAAGTINLIKNKYTHYVYVTDFVFWGRKFPLMTGEYDPALVSYILLPFFIVFGINVFSLRIAAIFFGLLTLLFTYLFAKKFFNRKVAIITILLLVSSPYFIFSFKLGNYFLTYALFFSVTALFSFLKWYEKGNIFYIIQGAFLLGLGFSTVISVGFLVISIAVITLFFIKEIKIRAKKYKTKLSWIFFLTVFFFCMGSFLFLYANFINVSTRFMTFKCISERFINTGYGVSNLDYLKNLGIRLRNVFDLAGEKDMLNLLFAYRKGNTVFLFAFCCTFLWLIYSLFFRNQTYFTKKRILFILSLVSIIVISSPFALSCLHAYHLIILVPYMQLLISVGLIEFSRCFRKKITQRISVALVSLILLGIVKLNFNIFKNCFFEMSKIGAQSVWSDTIYELADWLKEVKPSNIVVLTWGLSRNLYFLFKGDIWVHDLHSSPAWEFDEGNLTNIFKDFLKDGKSKYIANIQWVDQRAHMFFKRLINITGKSLVEEKTFYQRDGRPIYIVYSVREKR